MADDPREEKTCPKCQKKIKDHTLEELAECAGLI